MTRKELLENWRERDERYAYSRDSLTPEMIDAVRAGREREALQIPAFDLVRDAGAWTEPPKRTRS